MAPARVQPQVVARQNHTGSVYRRPWGRWRLRLCVSGCSERVRRAFGLSPGTAGVAALRADCPPASGARSSRWLRRGRRPSPGHVYLLCPALQPRMRPAASRSVLRARASIARGPPLSRVGAPRGSAAEPRSCVRANPLRRVLEASALIGSGVPAEGFAVLRQDSGERYGRCAARRSRTNLFASLAPRNGASARKPMWPIIPLSDGLSVRRSSR